MTEKLPWPAQASPSCAVVAANLPQDLCCEEGISATFGQFGEIINIELAPELRAARLLFRVREEAVFTVLNIHGKRCEGFLLRLYYTQCDEEHVELNHLCVPIVPRQYLVSPPASPPVGWEPAEEDPPVYDEAMHELLAPLMTGATVTLVDGAAHHPAITVEDSDRQHAHEHENTQTPSTSGGLLPPAWAPILLLPTRYNY